MHVIHERTSKIVYSKLCAGPNSCYFGSYSSVMVTNRIFGLVPGIGRKMCLRRKVEEAANEVGIFWAFA